jgi:hypothetical protein
LVHASEVVAQRLQVLPQQVTHRIRRCEFERQHAMEGKDAQEHLAPLLDLLDVSEPLIHEARIHAGIGLPCS